MSINSLTEESIDWVVSSKDLPKEDCDKILEKLKDLNIKYTSLGDKMTKICERKESKLFGFMLGGRKKHV